MLGKVSQLINEASGQEDIPMNVYEMVFKPSAIRELYSATYTLETSEPAADLEIMLGTKMTDE